MPSSAKIFRPHKPRQKQGGSSVKRDHSRAYRRLRLSVLDDEPLCRYCLREGRVSASTIVDHRLALCLGGTNDRANLAGSCKACNDEKAKAELAFLAKGYDVRDVLLDAELRRWLRDK